MFPQLGAPIGFLLSGGLFLLLSVSMSDAGFLSYGWRIPFLASSALILLGLYVRLHITETPSFLEASRRRECVAVPMLSVIREHFRPLLLGTLSALATFVIFYLLTVFCLSWGTTRLGYGRNEFLIIQLVGVLFFGATIPGSAWVAGRFGTRRTVAAASFGIILFGIFLGPLLEAGTPGIVATQIVGFALMGITYAPLGTLLSGLYPTGVRYTGASVSFSMAGILGASLAPYIATSLAMTRGLNAVGHYLAACAMISMIAVLLTEEKDGEH
jgi:MFS family permease